MFYQNHSIEITLNSYSIFIFLFFIIRNLGKDRSWCCAVLEQYPDVVPHFTLGSLNDEETKQEWGNKDCDIVVGGASKTNCPGKDMFMV